MAYGIILSRQEFEFLLRVYEAVKGNGAAIGELLKAYIETHTE